MPTTDHTPAPAAPRPGGLRVIVGGFIGLLPAGGVTWDYVQYVLGLRDLGHDVFYLEDTGLWPLWQASGPADAATANVRRLGRTMAAFGLADRWAYRDEVSGRWYGLPDARRADVVRTADVLVNVSGALVLRDELAAVRVRAMIDSDPMFTQVQYLSGQSLDGRPSGMRALLDGHTHHFSFAESIGEPGCRVPQGPFRWRPTRQPVALEWWRRNDQPGTSLTTVMNWRASVDLHHDGETWGQKAREFEHFMGLPAAVPAASFQLAVGRTVGAPPPARELRRNGWSVVDATRVTRGHRAYRSFLASSLGEFSVAKEAYVKARTGWFSCRSACYLASGRAVVTQDTGWPRHVPQGDGLFAFAGMDEAVAAVEEVIRRPRAQGDAARELAREHFAADRVLGRLLGALGD